MLIREPYKITVKRKKYLLSREKKVYMGSSYNTINDYGT
jgi:hypothetical protein